MEKLTNTLGGASLLLAQAFPAAAGTFPVTPDCVKSAFENVFYAPGNFPRGELVFTEPVPGKVVIGTLSSPTDNPANNIKITGEVTIGEDGLISSLSSETLLTNNLTGNFVRSATADVRYSRSGVDIDFAEMPPRDDNFDNILNASILGGVNAGMAQLTDQAMRQCGTQFISSTRPGTPFRLG